MRQNIHCGGVTIIVYYGHPVDFSCPGITSIILETRLERGETTLAISLLLFFIIRNGEACVYPREGSDLILLMVDLVVHLLHEKYRHKGN